MLLTEKTKKFSFCRTQTTWWNCNKSILENFVPMVWQFARVNRLKQNKHYERDFFSLLLFLFFSNAPVINEIRRKIDETYNVINGFVFFFFFWNAKLIFHVFLSEETATANDIRYSSSKNLFRKFSINKFFQKCLFLLFIKLKWKTRNLQRNLNFDEKNYLK